MIFTQLGCNSQANPQTFSAKAQLVDASVHAMLVYYQRVIFSLHLTSFMRHNRAGSPKL